jgi:hypothetical protein
MRIQNVVAQAVDGEGEDDASISWWMGGHPDEGSMKNEEGTGVARVFDGGMRQK